MGPLGYAIVGCGRVFESHLAGVRQCGKARLTALCDLDAGRADAAARLSGVDVVETEYRRILERRDVDIVDICLPHHLHCQAAMDTADAKKHVLCEKPIATTHEDALRMIAKTEEQGVMLGVVYQNRYNTASRKVRKAVDSGRFGRLIAAYALMHNSKPQSYYENDWHGQWATAGGGTLTTQAIHSLDLLCWYLGQPLNVTAHMGALTHDAPVEDTAAAAIEFENGAVGTIISTNCSHIRWSQRLEIIGTEGCVVIEDNRIRRWDFSSRVEGDDETGDEDADAPLPGPPGYGPSHPRLIRDFVDSVVEGHPFPIDGWEGLKVSLVLWSMYRSALTGRREAVNKAGEERPFLAPRFDRRNGRDSEHRFGGG
jgi:predicted dehydrogenase